MQTITRSTQPTELYVTPVPDPRRWWALAAIAIAQLLIVVDGTIMNIALPSVQRSLHLSDPSRQWVITIYALTYGGLLLLGGRISDLIGRKRAILIGMIGFALASAVGGAAQSGSLLLVARAGQGVAGALLTPSAVALLAATFTSPSERGRAFGIYGAFMGSGSGIGVIAGGLLTEYLNWRWAMYVSVPIALIAGAGVLYAVKPVPRQNQSRIDVIGAALVTGGLMALVFGFSRAEEESWSAGITIASLAAGVALLVGFVFIERVVANPLLPLRVILDRRRGSSYLAALAMSVGTFGAFFFLTFYLQNILGYSPIKTGLAFLPFTAAVLIGARFVSPLMSRLPVRNMLVPGLISAAIALGLLSLVDIDSGYWTHVLPVFLLLGIGPALVFLPANYNATLNAGADTSVAGASVMTSQQIGSALGTAVLSTIAGTAAANYLDSHSQTSDLVSKAAVHGFNVASLAGAAFLLITAIAIVAIAGREAPPSSAQPS